MQGRSRDLRQQSDRGEHGTERAYGGAAAQLYRESLLPDQIHDSPRRVGPHPDLPDEVAEGAVPGRCCPIPRGAASVLPVRPRDAAGAKYRV